jgi:hypothetical protein
VLKRHHHCENNELSELAVLRYKEQEIYAFVETLMLHAIQIRQAGDPGVLNWTPIEVGEPGSGQVRLRQAAAGLNYIDVYHRTGYYSQPLPFIPGLEGAEPVEAIGQDVRGVKVGDRMAYVGPAGGYSEVRIIEADRQVRLLDAISFDQAAAMMLFSGGEKLPVVFDSVGKDTFLVNQRFAHKNAADAHKALEARTTSGSTVLTI